ncbi:MAG: YeeE/YedE family protein [Deltaproteobacteria bacterium]|nr:YeeE/YedE family protein [Deltaproteobacteria bacterium]
MNFPLLCMIGFLFGIGFGYFVQRAGLCFSHGLAEIFIGKGKRICRLFSVIFIITATGFLISGYISPQLGLKPVGELRGAGFYNVLSGIFFGAGILLNGGCVLGTLRQIGEGNLNFVVAFISFIPGMALVVYIIDPLLEHGYNTRNILLSEMMGVDSPWVTGALVLMAVLWLSTILRRKR